MVMTMTKEDAKSAIILFHAQKFLNIKVHQLIFANPMIRSTRLKLLKKILGLASSKTNKKNKIMMIYISFKDLLTKFTE